MKALILALVLCCPVCLFGQTNFRKSYDKFKDKTTLTINIGTFLIKTRNTKHALDMLVVSEFEGSKMLLNPAVSLFFISASKEWQFLKSDLSLRALVDNKRVSLGLMKRADSDTYSGGVSEILSLPTNWKTLKNLGTAKIIEMQIGDSEFALSPEQIDRFNIFVEFMEAEIPKVPSKLVIKPKPRIARKSKI